jgi:hypothetical protein
MDQSVRQCHVGRCNRKRCGICHENFTPHPRLGDRQILCGDANCRKEYLRRYRRRYRLRNLSIEQEYQTKRSGQRPADYWRVYRQAHPDYREREKTNAQRRKRKNLGIEFLSSQQGSQRQLDILQPLETTGESIVTSGSQRQLDMDYEEVLVDDSVNTNKEALDGVAANTKEFFLDRPGSDPIGRLGETFAPGAADLRCPVCHMRPGGFESLERSQASEFSRD